MVPSKTTIVKCVEDILYAASMLLLKLSKMKLFRNGPELIFTLELDELWHAEEDQVEEVDKVDEVDKIDQVD